MWDGKGDRGLRRPFLCHQSRPMLLPRHWVLIIPTLAAHGAEILVADYGSEVVEGKPASVTIVVKFSSKEAARAWYDSPEYQAIVRVRTDNTEGFLILADGFVMP